MDVQKVRQFSPERLPHETPKMTLEEFLESDLEGEEKAFAYLEVGAQLVWVIKPRSKTVMVYRSEIDITLLTRNDTLSGEEVVQGFSCQVAELFE